MRLRLLSGKCLVVTEALVRGWALALASALLGTNSCCASSTASLGCWAQPGGGEAAELGVSSVCEL